MQSLFDHGGFAACPAPFNMAAYVLARGADFPDAVALRILSGDTCEIWRYGDLIAAVRGTATGLTQLGVRPGDRVLMRLGNTVDFPIVYLAALSAGLVPVPTSSALTVPETANIIATLQPKIIVRDTSVACPDAPNIVPLAQVQKMRTLPPAAYHMGDPNRPGYIIYTSGTSGQPRAVVHAHRAIWARQMMFDGWYGMGPEDRVLHAGAFNWTYTLGTGLMDPWTLGAQALIPAAGTPATDLPELIAQQDATIFAAAPGVYRQLLAGSDVPDMPSLRHGLSAGEKLPSRLRDRWQNVTGTPIFEAYGMSECSTFLSASPAHPPAGDALGRPQPGRIVALLGDEGPVPRGTEGTIAVHRSDPGLMLGYLDAPDETAARMQGDWFLTGDQGVMERSGDIRYLGRADDMMNAGGFRVSPIEVEQAIATYPGVTGVGCAEVSVKADTTVIAAFYTSKEPLDEVALRAFVAEKLARYKQPRLYVRLDALPVGANNKILRKKLAAYAPPPA
ncbi:class I adenylate-forming enzyme family protein [Sulfitobacter sp. S190]|uniref:class I adenylate-forming enzyme family protein n=1 Tax=Sulfitobacter sp. S190 TaxID=2867022 RepID=UPI0021A3E0A1|nr:class I adenylate-forming enzyme family protein [Sulfitobacter sp. S190]UWR24020.1 acyl--CoA ligase [Sulfitobacter sp. S190]